MLDLYLDVDGVILPVVDPVLGPDRRCSGWVAWRPVSDVVGADRYAPGLVTALNVLADHPDVNVWWLTTWRGRANDLSDAIGLPRFPVLDRDFRHDRAEAADRRLSSWWKRDAIIEHHGGRLDATVVWVDDDLDSDQGHARAWLRAIGGVGIQPVTTVGMTRWDVREIEVLLSRI